MQRAQFEKSVCSEVLRALLPALLALQKRRTHRRTAAVKFEPKKKRPLKRTSLIKRKSFQLKFERFLLKVLKKWGNLLGKEKTEEMVTFTGAAESWAAERPLNAFECVLKLAGSRMAN